MLSLHFITKSKHYTYEGRYNEKKMKSGNLTYILNSPRGVARSKPEALLKQLLIAAFTLFVFFNEVHPYRMISY